MKSEDNLDFKSLNGGVVNDYEFVKLLGQGAFGMVFKAKHRTTGEEIAIKAMEKTVDNMQNFSKEVATLMLLNNNDEYPSRGKCVKYLQSFAVKKICFMCMELLGPCLLDFMKEQRQAKKRFPIEGVKNVLGQIMKGVNFLHSIGVIHSDLKPENIVFQSDEDSTVPVEKRLIKIVDFGNAVWRRPDMDFTVTTPLYRAPEVWLKINWTEKVDLWSLGCIAMEMFIGAYLFRTVHARCYLRAAEKLCGEKIPISMRHGKNANYFLSCGDVQFCRICYENPAMEQLECLGLTHDETVKKFKVLCDSLFRIDPSQRSSAEEALKQNFFK